MSIWGTTVFGNIQIKQMEISQVQEVKHMIVESILQNLPMTIEDIEELDKQDEFADVFNVQSAYYDNGGMFYVVLDEDKIVGSGAIKKFDDETCELKRMWLLKPYIGHGYGLAMANKLFEFAKNHGYKRVVLDVYSPETQQKAVTFYKKLGFYEIKPYKKFLAKLYMEKILN